MDGSIGFSLPSQASASIATSLEKGIAHGNTKVMARQIASMPIHVQSRRRQWWQGVSAMLVVSDALLITLSGLAQRLHSDWHDGLEASQHLRWLSV